MIACKSFKTGVLAVFIFILLMGPISIALAQESNTRTGDQSSTSEIESQTHNIVLINGAFSPDTTEINQYDTVIWRNLNRPKRSFVLVSEDNLWEDFKLGYGKSFQYTFEETGTFGFSIEGERDMVGTVVVREERETAERTPASERETRPQVQQEEREQQNEEKVTPTATEKEIPKQTVKRVQSSENSIAIQGSDFYPDTLELDTGETITWKNLNRPKRPFTLVSEDRLFGNELLGYGKSFSYTFNEAGDYTFRLDEIPGSELTVKVEKK
ncbi:MAG TPA: hypothetical protein HA306_03035 [Methanosarcina sp.]|nr:hypothetical protein [Methanosarcina sp.]